MNAEQTVKQGEKFPYDAPDSWWQSDGDNPPPASSWEHLAARGILADLTDRHTIKRGFENVDEEIRAEIVSTLAGIIHYVSFTNIINK